MRAGFPKNVERHKVGKGHYLLIREDGYSVELRRSPRGYFYQTSNFARFATLRVAIMDLSHGYMPRDGFQEVGTKDMDANKELFP